MSAEREVDLATVTDVFEMQAADAGDKLGVRAESCDVDGDGLLDLVLGADSGDGPANTRPSAGEAYVVLGKRRAWRGSHDVSETAATVIYGQDSNDDLGRTVACGDVNGDGIADILLGARLANGPNNTRDTAGQVHVIFGRPVFPPSIDLATDPAPVIWGAEPNDAIGRAIAVGDIDGDGIADAILGTGNGKDRTNSILRAGRVYVVFGRTDWPQSTDLASGADLIVFGDTENDFLGDDCGVADLDGDGIAELVAVATQGDGPLDFRVDCGELRVWRGRITWPTEIDLASDDTDMLVYGADEGDLTGGTGKELRFGDPDADGTVEILTGADLAWGAFNAGYATGEGRLYGPGAIFPPSVDLAIDRDAVIYGRQADDFFCAGMRTGDTDGDGVDDFVCDAPTADGPQDQRADAGEVYVIHGGVSFPDSLDLATEQADLIVFGREPADQERIVALSDLNADGIRELVMNAQETASHLRLVTLASPYDIDGDGITQLEDNCPLVANPDQSDGDGDLVGDACAGDWDGDGQADESDCAPSDGSAGTPGEVTGAGWEPGSDVVLTWDATEFSSSYELTRGELTGLGPGSYGRCVTDRDPDPTDTRFEDPELPLAGDGWSYLVRGRNTTCALSGTWGSTSAGSERENTDPAACP